FSSRRRHTRFSRDWSSDVCSSDLQQGRSQSGCSQLSLRLEKGVDSGGFLAFSWSVLCESGKRTRSSSGQAREQGQSRRVAGNPRSEERRVGKEGRQR